MVDKTNVYLLKMIKGIFEDGIYLGPTGSSKEYLSGICNYFNSKNETFAHFDHKMLQIEDSLCNPIVSLMVRNDTLYILPAKEVNFFICFKDILEYICKINEKEKIPSDNSDNSDESDNSDFDWV